MYELIPVLCGSQRRIGDIGHIYAEWNSNSSNSRTVVSPDGMKLCISKEEPGLLFDLEKDPSELVNLIDHPNYQEAIKELTKQLLKWQRETGDTLKLN